jgi:hypothetical protein
VEVKGGTRLESSQARIRVKRRLQNNRAKAQIVLSRRLVKVKRKSQVEESYVFASLIALVTASDPLPTPKDLVGQALVAEASGEFGQRRELLQAARRQDSKNERVHWQIGELKSHDRWISAREATASIPEAKYLERRASTPQTWADQYRLAKWCKAQGLGQEAYAHLRVAARLSPGAADVQKALGRKEKEGVWGTDEEHARRAELRRIAEAANREWTTRLRSIPSDAATLPKLTDPLAIPAVEQQLSLRSENLAKLAVAAISGMDHSAANAFLVRQATYSNWESVRKLAAVALRLRPPEQSVPALIELLRPSASGTRFVSGIGQVWYWQDFDHTYLDLPTLARSDRLVPRERNPALRDLGRGERVVNTNRLVADERTASGIDGVEEQMVVTDVKNQSRLSHATAALQIATGQSFPPEQAAWRAWWNEAADRPAEDQPEPPQRDLVVTQSTSETTSLGVNLGATVVGHACFASGTPVWTSHGLEAIDKIQLGDYVFAQSIETGELAYKPVVFRTLLPRTKAKLLRTASETIHATTAHPFWVAGRGWTKVKALNAGTPLRTVDDVVRLEEAAEGEKTFAYNLEVADFGTYFVGKTGFLVHDNTPIRDLPRKAPGLEPTVSP